MSALISAASLATPLRPGLDGSLAYHPRLLMAVAGFLVSIPVFFQAPLVRLYPWVSLGLTPLLWGLAGWLILSKRGPAWGDLLFGFSCCWLAGSVYWGWLRWEPLWHLPIEAFAVPLVTWLLWRGQLKIGGLFYLGSLLGTAITDLYFYLIDVIPHWRSVMRVEAAPDLVMGIFQDAVIQVQTFNGQFWAMLLVLILVGLTLAPFFAVNLQRRQSLAWWGFIGAVGSTLLVDGVFWVVVVVQ
ncbi:DUF3120 domain-containing protein [Synechococcus sp. PCC 6312]|uniref:DUF3120 domain-containing protein n=1 Tax=Synechococcus sp. (strain ATCC 27167 / PCC 6312) TaxID=195253 RepID=UPI00209E5B5F|nr:DUF3120 domain-containing protein [Synechococcus sp. PCC 6312]